MAWSRARLARDASGVPVIGGGYQAPRPGVHPAGACGSTRSRYRTGTDAVLLSPQDRTMRRFLPLNPDAGLLILRVVLGIIMMYHGWPKLTNLGGVIEGFSGMGIPLPAVAAVFSMVAEFFGGLLLLVGV